MLSFTRFTFSQTRNVRSPRDGNCLLNALLVATFIFGCFSPSQLGLIGLGAISRPLRMVGYIFGIAYLLINARSIKLDYPTLATVLFVTLGLVLTALKGDFSTLYLQTLISMVLICLVTQVSLKGDPVLFVTVAFYVIGFLVIANAAFILISLRSHPSGYYQSGDPDAMTGVWLLGHKNQLRNWIIPAIALSHLLDVVRHKGTTVRTLIVTVIGILSAYYSDSATSFAVLLFFSALLLFSMLTNSKKPVLLDPVVGGVFSAVVFFVCVILRRVPLLGSVIENGLGRDASFTGRTSIWDDAMSWISNEPFGTGFFTVSHSRLMNDSGWVVNHAHDAYLDTTLKYGFAGLAIFIALVVMAIKSLAGTTNWQVRVALSACLVSFLICGIFGELFNSGYFLVLYLCCYCDMIGPQVDD